MRCSKVVPTSIQPSKTPFRLNFSSQQIEVFRKIAQRIKQPENFRRSGKAPSSSFSSLALFSGPSGTGKTMAAERIARELHTQVHRVTVKQVVSKYIGETEKNLARVFETAQKKGAVLLFDEADALFGKRSQVRDSHDRYANVDVGYLLAKIEAYRGLVILTCNQKTNVDPRIICQVKYLLEFSSSPSPRLSPHFQTR